MREDRIDLSKERGNDTMLKEHGIWDEVKTAHDKMLADAAEEDAKVAAMKPGDDGNKTTP